jgi:hypothetical protein
VGFAFLYTPGPAMTLSRSCVVALVLCPLLAGCPDRPALGKLRGTVKLDNRPLARATLTFEATGARPATATVVNGEIVEATTYDTGDGVPVGQHRVAVDATEEAGASGAANPGDAKAPGANYMVGRSLIPARYNDPSTSGLTADIKKGDNWVEFNLTSQPPKPVP